MIEDENNTFEKNVMRTENEFKNIEEKELELRMYFFVPYNISEIAKGIQSGHALGRHCLKYGRHDPNHIVWDFLEKWETWIILNGGTTNDERDFEMIPVGSLNLIADQLQDNDIEFAYMIEPDLNHALTALSVICDERVFNRKDYPDFINYILDVIYPKNGHIPSAQSVVEMRMRSEDELRFVYPEYYKKWVRFLGGEKNLFLRELIKDKRLA